MENLPSKLWIWLSLMAASVWVAISVADILTYDGSPTAITILGGITVFGAVLIIAMGAVMRWYTDLVRGRRDDAAAPARPAKAPHAGGPRLHGNRWRNPSEQKAAALMAPAPRHRSY